MTLETTNLPKEICDIIRDYADAQKHINLLKDALCTTLNDINGLLTGEIDKDSITKDNRYRFSDKYDLLLSRTEMFEINQDDQPRNIREKSIVLRLSPDQCFDILNHDQSAILLRKSIAELMPDEQYRCYIYCDHNGPTLYKSARDNQLHIVHRKNESNNKSESRRKLLANNGHTILNGTIIGEMICDRVDIVSVTASSTIIDYNCLQLSDKLPMSYDEITAYILPGCKGYLLNISNLTEYDVPKHMSDFAKTNDSSPIKPPAVWMYANLK
ncbi:hypothetical protein J6A31_08925 [bacterium]|nr:hypothetical protein [bacterium]